MNVLESRTMDEAYEKVVRQEQRLEKDDSFRDKNRNKGKWNQSHQNFKRKGCKNNQYDYKKDKKDNNNTRKDEVNSNKGLEKKGPLGGCFTCRGEHYANQCPTKNQHGQQERNPLPPQQTVFQQRIHATVDNRQAEYQVTPIETPGMLYGNLITILIDTGVIECFISPKLLGRFPKRTVFMAKSWTVEYANQTRARVE